MKLIHKKAIVTFFFLVGTYTFSQLHLGFTEDNYSGVYGLVSNPANVVDSRHRFNVNVISFNGLFASDYQVPKLGNLSLFNIGFKKGLFDGILDQVNGPENNQTYVNLDVLMPGSFMLNINDRHAVGLLVRGRSFSNYNNFNGPLWQGLANGFSVEQDFEFDNPNLDVTNHHWYEIGLTYGIVVLDGDEHFLKAGGTFKFLQGLGAEQLRTSQRGLEGRYNASGANSTINMSGDLEYITTFRPNTLSQSIGFGERLKNAASGIGADVGFIYEYRTRETRRVGIGKNALGSNKYKLKVAVSMLDLGKIDYGPTPVRNFSMGATSINAIDATNNFLGALNTAMAEVGDPGQGKLEVALPTSVQVGVDYLLRPLRDGGAFYLNGSLNRTVIEGSVPFNNNRLNLYAIAPRYEEKNYSFYMPVTYSEVSSVNFGLGGRVGPITFGSGSLINLFTGDGSLNNLYVGLSIPAYQDKNQAFRRKGSNHKKRRKHKRWGKRGGRRR